MIKFNIEYTINNCNVVSIKTNIIKDPSTTPLDEASVSLLEVIVKEAIKDIKTVDKDTKSILNVIGK